MGNTLSTGGKITIAIIVVVVVAGVIVAIVLAVQNNKKKCNANTDCSSNQLCVRGKCETKKQCPSNQVLSNDNTCVSTGVGCVSSSQCQQGFICANNTCIPQPVPGPIPSNCSTINPSGTCPVGLICSQGTCVSAPCSSSAPSGTCPTNQTCIQGTCNNILPSPPNGTVTIQNADTKLYFDVMGPSIYGYGGISQGNTIWQYPQLIFTVANSVSNGEFSIKTVNGYMAIANSSVISNNSSPTPWRLATTDGGGKTVLQDVTSGNLIALDSSNKAVPTASMVLATNIVITPIPSAPPAPSPTQPCSASNHIGTCPQGSYCNQGTCTSTPPLPTPTPITGPCSINNPTGACPQAGTICRNGLCVPKAF